MQHHIFPNKEWLNKGHENTYHNLWLPWRCPTLCCFGKRVTKYWVPSERFKDFVEGHGLEFGYMNDRLLSIVDTDQGKDMIENTTNIFDVVK